MISPADQAREADIQELITDVADGETPEIRNVAWDEIARRDAQWRVVLKERDEAIERIDYHEGQTEVWRDKAFEALETLKTANDSCERLEGDLTDVSDERDKYHFGRDWQYDKAVAWRNRAVKAEADLLRAEAALRAFEDFIALVKIGDPQSPRHQLRISKAWAELKDPIVRAALSPEAKEDA